MKKSTSYRLEIITPERVVFNHEVVFSVIPSGLGPIGILPGHAPLLGTVINGALKVRDTDKRDILAFVRNGFFMISNEGVSIITRSAELQHQIDVQRATAAKERALKLLSSKQTGIDVERAREALRRAELRLKVAQGAVA
ncbi:MAG: ATP synthase F1 subunit epsilon [Desulfobacterota bacterium]|nr:ATP synthase F1 subunit epsilon [Thermodesulfobacteriota bacterium]